MNTIVAASIGNVGSSLARLCALYEQQTIIMILKTTSLAKLTQVIGIGIKAEDIIALDRSERLDLSQ